MFGLVLSAYVSTVYLVTLKFQASEHPPLASFPHPVGPSASFANSTGQKPRTIKAGKKFEVNLLPYLPKTNPTRTKMGLKSDR